MKPVFVPIPANTIRSLHAGENVALSGVILTGRDAAHKWMCETFIRKTRTPTGRDQEVYAAILPLLDGGVIYHCGPVVAGRGEEPYTFVAAGPTTSIREEPYQAEVMRHFNLRGVIGKGGMGGSTLAACVDVPAVYFHAVGGAAALLASTVRRVCGVYLLEFGIPEAMWVIEVQDFPAVVTMDSYGRSLHDEIERSSRESLKNLLDTK